MVSKTLVIFDRIIEYGIIFLIILTPLAFGSVQLWAYSTMELVIGFLVIIWMSKLIVINISNPQEIQNPNLLHRPDKSKTHNLPSGLQKRQYSSHEFSAPLNRFGFVKTPLNIPIIFFIVFVFFQLIPLPPVAIKLLSPETYHLYRESLPGWPAEEPFSMKSLSSNENFSNHNLAPTNQISNTEFMTRTTGLVAQNLATIQNSQLISNSVLDESEIRNPRFEIRNWKTISINCYASKVELLKILSYIGIFFLIANTPNLKINRIIVVIISVGFFISLVGILQNLTGSAKMIYWVRDASNAHPFGPYYNRNNFANYIGMVIFLSSGLLISRFANVTSKTTKQQHSVTAKFQEHLFTNFLLIFINTIMISALFLSLSRGGILSFTVGMLVFFAFIGSSKFKLDISKGRSIIFSALTLTFLFLIWIGLNPVLNRLSDLSSGERPEVYQNTINMISDFPVFGTGLGTFQYIYPKYRTPQTQHYYDHTHNDYLELLSDCGLVGFLITLSGFALFFWKTLTRWLERRDPYAKGVALGGGCGILTALTHSFAEFNLHIPANALFFFILLGLIYNTVNLRMTSD